MSRLDRRFDAAPHGPRNTIADVDGITVGSSTIWDPERAILSGVTAIRHDRLDRTDTLPAGFFCGNGYGKFVGSTQVQELGVIETPLLLTSTLSTFRVADALITWLRRHAGHAFVSINPVVGEINDGWLSTGVDRPVTPEHVWAALDGATDQVALGSVGAGTGACALGFKAGLGSASRVVEIGGARHTVGVLVLANMGGTLRLGHRTLSPADVGLNAAGPLTDDGSCIVVVATDAPCSAVDLTRLARRGVFGIGRAGAAYSHGSGDYGIALSTNVSGARELSPMELDRLFESTLDAVEESVLDALCAATTVSVPSGRTAHAVPVDDVSALP